MCAYKHHGNLRSVPVTAEAQIVVVHCLEADLILQAEDEDHRIYPGGELEEEDLG